MKLSLVGSALDNLLIYVCKYVSGGFFPSLAQSFGSRFQLMFY